MAEARGEGRKTRRALPGGESTAEGKAHKAAALWHRSHHKKGHSDCSGEAVPVSWQGQDIRHPGVTYLRHTKVQSPGSLCCPALSV